MTTFEIPVRNELTGEVRVVEITCGYHVEAQIEALHQLFRHEGWRKAIALQPEAMVNVA